MCACRSSRSASRRSPAEGVYDATARFCERFLEKRDRTVDPMVQAARSGKQNIIRKNPSSRKAAFASA
jgi:hypothetical protein